jgi:hypothetical protein
VTDRSRAARRATASLSLPRRIAAAMRDKPCAVRWLVAELIPFGCLFIGMLLVPAVAPVGFILALFGGVILTVWYLNWVQGTHAAWVLPLIGLMLPATIVGTSIFGHAVSKGEPLVVTPAYWQAFGGLLAALAVTVALAIVNGERHHGRYSYMVRR